MNSCLSAVDWTRSGQACTPSMVAFNHLALSWDSSILYCSRWAHISACVGSFLRLELTPWLIGMSCLVAEATVQAP